MTPSTRHDELTRLFAKPVATAPAPAAASPPPILLLLGPVAAPAEVTVVVVVIAARLVVVGCSMLVPSGDVIDDDDGVIDSLGVTDGRRAEVVNVTVGGGEVTDALIVSDRGPRTIIEDVLRVTGGVVGVVIVAVKPETWVLSLVVARLSSSFSSASFSLLQAESLQHLTSSLKIPQREPCSQ